MQKHHIKLILWPHDKNSSGHLPIYTRITIDRETKYIATGHHIPKNQWDEKNERVKDGHQLSEIINADILYRKQLISKSVVESIMKGETITAGQVKAKFSSGKNLHNFFDFVDEFSREVEHKRSAGTLENYRKHSLRLQLYHGSKELSFEQMDRGFLSRYEQHLRATVGNNYIHALFKTLRTFFNAARKRGIITTYPFNEYEGVKYKAPVKDYLTLKELDKLEKFADTTKDTVLKQTAIYFLLGCYTGLRISDWPKFSLTKNVNGGRLYLRATKNNEWVTMPVTGRLKKHLPRLKVKLTIEEPTINEKLKVIATKENISKRITSHTGRHTFAITMCADQGISSETCAELMGIQIKTCIENYYKVSNRKIDKETLAAWSGL